MRNVGGIRTLLNKQGDGFRIPKNYNSLIKYLRTIDKVYVDFLHDLLSTITSIYLYINLLYYSYEVKIRKNKKRYDCT